MRTTFGRVAELAYATASDTVFCGFDSRPGYHYNDPMSNLQVGIEEFLELKQGEIHGRPAYRLVVDRTGEPRRGIFTMVRDGETNAQTIDRLIRYHAANELPAVDENHRLTEI